MAQPIRDLGITLHTPNLKNGKDILRFRSISRKIIQNFQPDIIHGWMYHGNIVATWMRKKFAPATALAWSIHHTVTALSAEKWLTRKIIQLGAKWSEQASLILYVSQRGKQQHEAIGYASQYSEAIPNGFDTAKFIPNPRARKDIRHPLGIADTTPLIGIVGRFHPVKDYPNFMAAFAQTKEAIPSLMGIMVGGGVDRDNALITSGLEEFGLGESLYPLGPRQDIAEIMSALDVLVLSSKGEAFPMVLGEAMSCGVPCVSTDVGDAAWIMGETGHVVPPGDAKALADAITGLLQMSLLERQQMGLAARQRIISHFTLPQIMDTYVQAYRSCI